MASRNRRRQASRGAVVSQVAARRIPETAIRVKDALLILEPRIAELLAAGPPRPHVTFEPQPWTPESYREIIKRYNTEVDQALRIVSPITAAFYDLRQESLDVSNDDIETHPNARHILMPHVQVHLREAMEPTPQGSSKFNDGREGQLLTTVIMAANCFRLEQENEQKRLELIQRVANRPVLFANAMGRADWVKMGEKREAATGVKFQINRGWEQKELVFPSPTHVFRGVNGSIWKMEDEDDFNIEEEHENAYDVNKKIIEKLKSGHKVELQHETKTIFTGFGYKKEQTKVISRHCFTCATMVCRILKQQPFIVTCFPSHYEPVAAQPQVVAVAPRAQVAAVVHDPVLAEAAPDPVVAVAAQAQIMAQVAAPDPGVAVPAQAQIMAQVAAPDPVMAVPAQAQIMAQVAAPDPPEAGSNAEEDESSNLSASLSSLSVAVSSTSVMSVADLTLTGEGNNKVLMTIPIDFDTEVKYQHQDPHIAKKITPVKVQWNFLATQHDRGNQIVKDDWKVLLDGGDARQRIMTGQIDPEERNDLERQVTAAHNLIHHLLTWRLASTFDQISSYAISIFEKFQCAVDCVDPPMDPASTTAVSSGGAASLTGTGTGAVGGGAVGRGSVGGQLAAVPGTSGTQRHGGGQRGGMAAIADDIGPSDFSPNLSSTPKKARPLAFPQPYMKPEDSRKIALQKNRLLGLPLGSQSPLRPTPSPFDSFGGKRKAFGHEVVRTRKPSGGYPEDEGSRKKLKAKTPTPPGCGGVGRTVRTPPLGFGSNSPYLQPLRNGCGGVVKQNKHPQQKKGKGSPKSYKDNGCGNYNNGAGIRTSPKAAASRPTGSPMATPTYERVDALNSGFPSRQNPSGAPNLGLVVPQLVWFDDPSIVRTMYPAIHHPGTEKELTCTCTPDGVKALQYVETISQMIDGELCHVSTSIVNLSPEVVENMNSTFYYSQVPVGTPVTGSSRPASANRTGELLDDDYADAEVPQHPGHGQR